MLDRLKEFKWAAAVGASVVAFLFSTFATIAQVNKVADDTERYVDVRQGEVLRRLDLMQSTLNRVEDRLNK